MSQSVITYTNPAQHSASDDGLVEVASNVGRLKQQSYDNELFYAPYVSTIDATRSAPSGTGTAIGGASIVSNKLDLKGGTLKYVDYAGTDTPISNVGTIRVGIIPNYTGFPSSDRSIFSFRPTSGFSNVLNVYHATSGNFVIQLYASSGAAIFLSVSPSTVSATAGTLMDIEFNMDTTGTSRLFVDGVLVLEDSSTGTRTTPTTFRVGSNHSATHSPDFEVEYVQVYSTVQHTTAYTPDAKAVTYNTTAQSLQLVTGIGMDSLDGFAESVSVSGLDMIKYALIVDGVDKYWDGAAWSNSSGYAQTNTAAEIETNKDALDISLGASVQPKVYFKSEFGETTPTITSMTIDYDFFAAMISQQVCKVYGYVTHNLAAITSVSGYIKSSSPFFRDGNLITVNEPISVNANGYFEIDVPRSSQVLIYELSYTDPDGNSHKSSGRLVANVAEIELEDAIAAA